MDNFKSKLWKIAEPRVKISSLPDVPLPHLAAVLLGNRGISEPAAVEEFLLPRYPEHLHNPFLFKDMDKAAERIFFAIAEGQNIVVYGDYDADGVCSSVLLITVLRAMGAGNVQVYLPHREKEGYGLNEAAVAAFIKDRVNLIITLDCGTTNEREIGMASRAGLDVIVIDHHHAPDHLPGAFAVLNPKTPGETYPFAHLCSGGMAFKTAQALIQRRLVQYPDEFVKWSSFEKWLLDLAAIATVTDLVPLIGENRTLVKYGLKALNRTKRLGLKALVKAMRSDFGSLDTYSIAFQIGPRLNAAGRMDHANAAYELLMCDDNVKASQLADALEDGNRRRQQLTERITEEAREQVRGRENSRVLVAAGDGWPVGIVGLVASRLLEEYHRPVLIVGRSSRGLSGSGRSISAFDIILALHRWPQLFEKFGGHAQACGFTLKNEEALEQLQRRLNDLADEVLSPDDLLPVVNIDAVLALKDVHEGLGHLLEIMEPFGMANHKPKFIFAKVQVVGLMNVGANAQHLKLTLSDEGGSVRHAIGFNKSSLYDWLRLGDQLDVAAEITANDWNDRRDWQLKLIDMRPSLPD